MINLSDIIDQVDHVDDVDAADKAKSNSALAVAMRMWRPENWRGSGLTPDQILPIATECGIPVAWVPPTAVLVELAAAPQMDRMGILAAWEGTVLDHCEALMERCDDPEILDTRVLAQLALHAFRAGHHEAAMALAVDVAEAPALWASERRVLSFRTQEEEERYEQAQERKYKLAEREVELLSSDMRRSRFKITRLALLAPIPKFFANFYPDEGDPIPETVSRHATVHYPKVSHLTREKQPSRNHAVYIPAPRTARLDRGGSRPLGQ